MVVRVEPSVGVESVGTPSVVVKLHTSDHAEVSLLLVLNAQTLQ